VVYVGNNCNIAQVSANLSHKFLGVFARNELYLV